MTGEEGRGSSSLDGWPCLPAFDGRILAIDTAVAQRCAALHMPSPRSDRDALIAATALVHGMTVVTRKCGSLSATGVAVVNPWQS